MNLDELDALRALQKKAHKKHRWPDRTVTPEPSSTPLAEVDWKLVVGIAFGFLVWYVGAALFDQLLSP